MKVKVRKGVFETNSSSTHSLTMCLGTDFDEWKKGNMAFDVECDELVPIDALSDEEKETMLNGDYYDSRYLTYSQYEESYGSDFETFENRMTTPDGEEVVGFGYYGYN